MAFASKLTAAFAALLLLDPHVVFAAPAPGPAKPFDMPLDWTPFGFTTNVLQVGTPRQDATSFVDWTWIGQYLFTTLCKDTNNPSGCLDPKQAYFNTSKSTTFVNQTSLYPRRTWNPNHFFFYDDLRVSYGSDVLQVGPTSERITIMAADMNFKLNFPFPFLGVFGLSPVFKGDNASVQSPFYQMLQKDKYQSPIISFVYCFNSTFGNRQPAKSLCNNRDGLQTLGGYYSKHISYKGVEWHDNFVFPPVNEIDFEYDPAVLNYWGTTVVKHLIGNEEQPLNKTAGSAAIFDHASYGRGVPMSPGSYNRLIQITGGKPIELDEKTRPNNGNQSFVSVDCQKVKTFPPVKFQLKPNGRLWEVTAPNYVEKVKLPTGKEVCVLNVRTLGLGKDYIIGNFGETFAKEKVVLFDFEKLKVGIADLVF